MRVLITGASGFIGQHLCRHLVRIGHEVTAVSSNRAFVRDEMPSDADLARCRWSYVEDYRPAQGLTPELFRDIEVVMHLGAKAHVLEDQGGDRDSVYRTANVDSTISIARQSIRFGVGRFLFLSSIGVNGFKTVGTPFGPDDHPAPYDSYSRSKYEAEQALMGLFEQADGELVIVRTPLVYGPGVKGNFLRLLSLVSWGLPLPLGAVRNRRSFVGVGNLVDFLERCAVHPVAASEILVVSDGRDLSTPELLRILSHGLGVKSRLVHVPMPVLMSFAKMLGKGRTMEKLCCDLQVDASRSVRMLEWSAEIPVETGLMEMCAWFRDSVLSARQLPITSPRA